MEKHTKSRGASLLSRQQGAGIPATSVRVRVQSESGATDDCTQDNDDHQRVHVIFMDDTWANVSRGELAQKRQKWAAKGIEIKMEI